MSCCNNNLPSHNYYVENYCSSCKNPADFTPEDKTYTIGNTYYAPPWPADRSKYDQEYQRMFTTGAIPDFLNYSNTPTTLKNIGQLDYEPQHSHVTFDMFGNQVQKETRKSVYTGRYNNYSF